MSNRTVWKRGMSAGVALGAAMLMAAAPAHAIDGPVNIVDGDATGLDITVTTPIGDIGLPPVPAVEVPNGGGSATDSVVDTGVPGVAAVDALDVATSGTGAGTPDGEANSSTRAAGVDAGAGALTADVLASECQADADGASGSSTIAGGSAGGTPFPDGAVPPNTGGAIPGVGSLTLNSQSTTNTATSNEADVAALELELDNAALQGGVGVGRAHCLAAGTSAGGGSTPGNGTGPGPGSGPGAPGRSMDDDPQIVTGMLARTGPFAVGPMVVAGLILLALGTWLRRIGRTETATGI